MMGSLAPLAEILRQMFPAVDGAAVRRASDFARKGLDPSWLYGPIIDEEPWQADVFDSVPFCCISEDGSLQKWVGPGLLITNGCDFTRDPWGLFAACYPASEFDREKSPEFSEAMHSNTISNLIFLPAVPDLGDRVVDLSMVQTVSPSYIRKQFGSRVVALRGRLSQLGYYIFLMKLQLHLMRPENVEEFARAQHADILP